MTDHDCIQHESIKKVSSDISKLEGTLTQFMKNVADLVVSLENIIKQTDEKIEDKLKGNISEIKQHIEQGNRWRMAIIGIIFAGIVQIVAFSYFFGQLSRTVEVNTKFLDILRERLIKIELIK